MSNFQSTDLRISPIARCVASRALFHQPSVDVFGQQGTRRLDDRLIVIRRQPSMRRAMEDHRDVHSGLVRIDLIEDPLLDSVTNRIGDLL